MESKIFVLSLGVIAGGVLQTVVNFPLLKKIGYSFKVNLNLKGEALSNVWKRLIPGAIGIAVRQINLVADMILASLLVSGSIAALGYGNRLMQLPMGIFGIAAGVAVLPLFSKFVAEENWKGLKDSLRFSIISLSCIMLPITAIIAGLGKDFVTLLFMRGKFDVTSVNMTYSALLFYSLGIIFYSFNRLVIPVFYANKDTKTPVKISAFIVVINIVLNIILMHFMQHAGLALATSVSAMIQFFILSRMLKKKVPQIEFPKVWKAIMKIAFLSLLIFVGLTFANKIFTPANFMGMLIKAVSLSLVSILFFILFSQILKIEYSKDIRKNICRKFLKK